MRATTRRRIEVQPGRFLQVEVAEPRRRGGDAALILHGFTGSAETMRGVAAGLAENRRAILVDLVGHGGSDAPLEPDAYRMGRCLEDLCRVMDALGETRVHLIGYSMGARVALSFAAGHPDPQYSSELART